MTQEITKEGKEYIFKLLKSSIEKDDANLFFEAMDLVIISYLYKRL